MRNKIDIPDAHFGEVEPLDEIERTLPHPDDDPDVESDEYIKEVEDTYKDLYGFSIDDIVNANNDDEDDKEE